MLEYRDTACDRVPSCEATTKLKGYWTYCYAFLTRHRFSMNYRATNGLSMPHCRAELHHSKQDFLFRTHANGAQVR